MIDIEKTYIVLSLTTCRSLYTTTLLISMGESNTIVSAYTMYRHLQYYCSHPSIYSYEKDS